MKPTILYEFPFDAFSKEKIDLFHGTNFTILPTTKAKSVVTVHDLAYMIYPETTSEKIYNHHMKWVPYSVNEANRVIADSSQTKQDIMKLLHVPEEKIDVVYLAADPMFKPMSPLECEYVRERYVLPGKYVLYVGTIEPRKNLMTLIRAFDKMKKRGHIEEKLVIVGAKGWKFSPIFELMKECQLENDVIFLGYVNDEDLVSIYNGATSLVLPSVYEGFGLPLLEAMQCGIPVLGSNVSSIPEVIGDAGILVEPMDIDSWVDSIENVVSDKQLHQRLVSKSLERAAQFSWNKVAEQTIEVYNKTLAGSE
ncbi:glycosyltransferase family 4 protein [Brevibacillus sp. 179-C9.3 HS]|uniref:glycosyltransferase family 4 protein n=1 Tax=unclassified Brevibacillus TaxID=2684853 RepID=UPI00399EF1A4